MSKNDELDLDAGYYDQQRDMQKARRDTLSKTQNANRDKMHQDAKAAGGYGSAPKAASGKKRKSARKSAPSPTAGKDAEKLGKFREPKFDQGLNQGLEKAQSDESKAKGEAALSKAKNPDRSKAETVSTAPTKAPQLAKQRGKLRRAVSAVGRGFRKAGRGVQRAFADSPKSGNKNTLAKNQVKKAGSKG